MSNKQTAVDWLISQQKHNQFFDIETIEIAKEMEKERMRSYIEEKWKQYRIVTNEEDAWLFKEWLIEQTYGGNK
jgi:hypothetical protein